MQKYFRELYNQNNWWISIKWTTMNLRVKKLQEEIFRASKSGNFNKSNDLMKKLVKSESAKLLAIYIITQKNKGKSTPGIDGVTYLTPESRMELSKQIFNYKTYKFQPVIRCYISKIKNFKPKDHAANSHSKLEKNKTRALGIMTIKDRVMAKIISFALMAKWEALFESNVLGFRPGKSRQDAIFGVCNALCQGENVILNADIKNFFSTIKHKIILEKICLFRQFIKRILKIKIVEDGKSYKNKRGIVQGNPLSPVLANIALHGMQDLFGTHFFYAKHIKPNSKITCIRYADDFVIIAPSRKIITTWVIPKLEQFLDKRGLSLNNEKTKILTKEQGFSFLGYSIKQSGKNLIVKPKNHTYAKTIVIS